MAIGNFNPLSSFLSIASCLPLFSTWPLVWLVWGTGVFVVCCWQCEVVDGGGAILAKSCGGWFEFDKQKKRYRSTKGEKRTDTALLWIVGLVGVVSDGKKNESKKEDFGFFRERERVDVSWKEEWQLELLVR